MQHLSKLASLIGVHFDDEASAWRPQPGRVRTHSPVDSSDIVEREKARHRAAFLASDLHTVTLYRTFHPAHAYAQYLTSVRCGSIRRLISRLEVVVMVCMSTQGVLPKTGTDLRRRIGFVRSAIPLL